MSTVDGWPGGWKKGEESGRGRKAGSTCGKVESHLDLEIIQEVAARTFSSTVATSPCLTWAGLLSSLVLNFNPYNKGSSSGLRMES